MSLTQTERRALGCFCVRLNDVWHHERKCVVPTVETILIARSAPVDAGSAIVEAWTNQGPVPSYHRSVKRRLRRDWPVLATAIEHFVADRQRV